jgi:hypothetical protein
MKNEKLELLLNKVVEYNQLDACHFKGFLYKDSSGYYIKVLETISGTDIAVNDTLYLKEGEELYVTQADKPKLMRISLKSWHYRLMKFVLRSKTPTPKTMQNGCPYFWLLIFSLFACLFVALWEIIKFVFMLIPKVLIWGLQKFVDGWMRGIDDGEAGEYYWNSRDNSNGEMPITAKLYFDKSNEDFMDYFMLEKYKLSREYNYAEYCIKKEELEKEWKLWRAEKNLLRQKRNDKRIKELTEKQRKYNEYLRRQAERQAKWDARTKPIEDAFVKIFEGIRKAFTFNFDTKNVIKKTKQVIGALVTIILLGAAYFVINGIVYGLTCFIDYSIEHWYIYVGIGVIAVIVGIIYVLFLLVTGWAQSVVNKYKGGKKVWYIEPIIYLIWYPVKYVSLGLVYGLFYLIWIPIKFIFYNFLWKFILVPIGNFLWKVLCALGRGIVNSTGVFGEYFNASYTDYCPGIEWVDTEEEE